MEPMLDSESLRLMAKRAKLDKAKMEDLPLLINEDWGSDVLKRDYKNRLINPEKKEDTDNG
jgi:hypothetical protein